MTKRFGSILTNVEGNANQILRINSAGDGFEFFVPSVIPEFAISNKTETRALNCADTNIDELSNVIGTLSEDLQDVFLLKTSQTKHYHTTEASINSGGEWGDDQRTITHNLNTIHVKTVVLVETMRIEDFHYADNGSYRGHIIEIIDNNTIKVHYYYGRFGTSDILIYSLE